MRLIIFFVSVLFFQIIVAEDIDSIFDHFFLDRMPSSRVDAMGRITSVLTGPYFISFSNPALLVDAKNSVYFSYHSPPYYVLENIYSIHGGANFYIEDAGHFSFNVDYESFSEEFTVFTGEDPLDNSWTSVTPTYKMYSLSYSYDFKEILSAGLTVGMFEASVIDDDRAYPVDLGLSKKFHLGDKGNHIISLGIVGKNIFDSKIEIKDTGIGAEESTNYLTLPSLIRIGAAYSHVFEYSSEHYATTSFAVEYQDMLNYEYRTAIRLGAEVDWDNLLFLRGGYFSESLDTEFDPNTKEAYENFTYGFGAAIDFKRWFGSESPMSVNIDVNQLSLPSYIKDKEDWGSYYIVNVIFNYEL